MNDKNHVVCKPSFYPTYKTIRLNIVFNEAQRRTIYKKITGGGVKIFYAMCSVSFTEAKYYIQVGTTRRPLG